MPRVNLYLNEADYEKWVEIPNKSLFVAEAINDAMPKSFKHDPEPIKPQPAVDLRAVINDITNTKKTCEHGLAFCKFEKCRAKGFK